VRAGPDVGAYDTGVKVSDRRMDALPLTRHDWHRDWNYTLYLQEYDQAVGAPDPFAQPSPDLAWLCHRGLTGLPPQDWDALIAALMTLHDRQRETSLDKRCGHRPGAGDERRPSWWRVRLRRVRWRGTRPGFDDLLTHVAQRRGFREYLAGFAGAVRAEQDADSAGRAGTGDRVEASGGAAAAVLRVGVAAASGAGQ
jgi:hypothetical protein